MKGRHVVIRREFGTVTVMVSSSIMAPMDPIKSAEHILQMPEDLAVEMIGQSIRDWFSEVAGITVTS